MVFLCFYFCINKKNKVYILSVYKDEAEKFSLPLNDNENENKGNIKVDIVQENKSIIASPYLITKDVTNGYQMQIL